jgi:hypothetical protein
MSEDFDGQRIGPLHPVTLPGIYLSTNTLTSKWKWGAGKVNKKENPFSAEATVTTCPSTSY